MIAGAPAEKDGAQLDSELLRGLRLELELVRSVQGSGGWDVLGAGLQRFADLLERDMSDRKSNVPPINATTPAYDEQLQLQNLEKLQRLAQQLFEDVYEKDPVVAIDKVRELLKRP